MVVFIRTIILYAFVVIVMRVMGKRQIGELQPFELVIAIMLSELAAVPMQDTGIPLLHGIIPILTLMLLEIVISFLTLKFHFLRKIFCGTPSMVIRHGRLIEDELRRQRFNLNDLMEELRFNGYLNISDIEFAILENGGKLSIIPKSNKAPLTREDMNIVKPEEELPITLIMDGKVNKHNLNVIKKDLEWLNSILRDNNISNVDEVFLAMIDSNGKIFIQRRS
ncbi:uncharacterized membrane protein YcaP (DUF421 family) [Fonticella tunisiensis]|uniref:Uncharacterized membrane protein YcaP (DUF421 family) n=2 Tax=Fonticella tunisiensis TaxID=1096341 RepID=A0A4R7KSS9_9CLOT|nr:uncharacterized membrane protein YcaP (DUF421 family) [Fonticella tunisiensis]